MPITFWKRTSGVCFLSYWYSQERTYVLLGPEKYVLHIFYKAKMWRSHMKAYQAFRRPVWCIPAGVPRWSAGGRHINSCATWKLYPRTLEYMLENMHTCSSHKYLVTYSGIKFSFLQVFARQESRLSVFPSSVQTSAYILEVQIPISIWKRTSGVRCLFNWKYVVSVF